MDTLSILAAATSPETFFGSGIGAVIQAVASVAAIFVVLIGLMKVFKGMAGGQGGAAMKNLVGTVVLAAFLLNLKWIGALTSAGSAAVKAGLDTLKGVVG